MNHKGMQNCITDGSAKKIVYAMKTLLEARRGLLVSRGQFIRAWAKLRRMLELTPEYKAFRAAVILRAGGACEECAEVGHHVHHKKPVAFYPDLVLDVDNGQYLCFKHHRQADKQSRKTALRSAPKPDAHTKEPREPYNRAAQGRGGAPPLRTPRAQPAGRDSR